MARRALPILSALLVAIAELDHTTDAGRFAAAAGEAAHQSSAVLAAARTEDSAQEPRAWSMRPLWWRHVFGSGIGAKGLFVVDLDRDGQAEVVASSSSRGGFTANDSWILVERTRGTPGSYEVRFRSPVTGASLTALAVTQADGDAALEVVVATGSELVVYDGKSRAVEQVVPVPSSPVRSLTVADADGDGAPEYVVCSATELDVLGPDGALRWSLAVPCQDLAVGQVDGDAAPEIVIGDGDNPGYVIDGQTRAVEWTNGLGFGSHVRLGNLDDDRRLEVVAGATSTLRVFDAGLQSLQATLDTNAAAGALELLDIEGDGPLEIVCSERTPGYLRVLDGVTLVLKWQVYAQTVTDVALGDPDGDGARELVWANGYDTSGPDRLNVTNTTSHTLEWQSQDVGGPFLGLEVATPVGSRRRAVLGVPSILDSGDSASYYYFHDSRTGEAFYQSPAVGYPARLRAAQADVDAPVEVLVAGSWLSCYDSLTHAVQWQVPYPYSLTVASLAVADLDGDGLQEVIVGGTARSASAVGARVLVYDAETGALEWQSPKLARSSVDLPWLRVAQLDADKPLEVVVGATNGHVSVLHPAEQLNLPLGWQDVSALEVWDGDDVAELFVGTSSGAVRRLDPLTGAVLATPFGEAARVDALAIGDLDGDGAADYATASGNVVRVRSGVGGDLLWASEVLAGPGSVVGDRDSLLMAQVDGQGPPELVVNLGRAGFVVLTSAP